MVFSPNCNSLIYDHLPDRCTGSYGNIWKHTHFRSPRMGVDIHGKEGFMNATIHTNDYINHHYEDVVQVTTNLLTGNLDVIGDDYSASFPLMLVVKAEVNSDNNSFAEWVADEIFSPYWEFNYDAFAEVACRKLAMLGIVKKDDDKWVLVKGDEDGET